MVDGSEPRVAVVTGGASGIGSAVSERLCRDGVAVAILDLDRARAVAAAERLEQTGGRAIGLRADVSERSHVEAAVAEVAERIGPPTILVNNAGVPSAVPFLELTIDEWQGRLGVNLTGTFHCCQVVLPFMVEAGWGRIVNISSGSTHAGVPWMSAYVASKAGVNGLTKCLALEFARKGVTVNAILPGFTDTPMLRASAERGEIDVDAVTRRLPVGRLGTPEDMAAVCSFLCREEAGFVTGQIVGVNGGQQPSVG